MGNRISGATERALAMVLAGHTPYAAARANGLNMSTVYRAIRREIGDQAVDSLAEAYRSMKVGVSAKR